MYSQFICRSEPYYWLYVLCLKCATFQLVDLLLDGASHSLLSVDSNDLTRFRD